MTPGAHDAVLKFNDRLRQLSQRRPSVQLIDLYVEVVSRGYLDYLSPYDGHLNPDGNRLLANSVVATVIGTPNRRGPSRPTLGNEGEP